MKRNLITAIALTMTFSCWASSQDDPKKGHTYPIVDTNQQICYDAKEKMDAPVQGTAFYGQDAQYTGNQPSYKDNGDGTITDLVTGLMWQKSSDINEDGNLTAKDKLTYKNSLKYAKKSKYAGYTDWRIPTIKELYSLIDFSGVDPSGYQQEDLSGLRPFINTNYFSFEYGDTNSGERIIDSQYVTTSLYKNKKNELLFGVNFADGRIKGYGLKFGRRDKTFCVLLVRGTKNYGKNNLVDNGDGTVSDKATGLMWNKEDSRIGMNWERALGYAEQSTASGYSDWRLPNAKELQSIVDYDRAPDVTNSAAIDPIFSCTSIFNEANQVDYPYYWTSTTHANWTAQGGNHAIYVSFGRAMGYMSMQRPEKSENSSKRQGRSGGGGGMRQQGPPPGGGGGGMGQQGPPPGQSQDSNQVMKSGAGTGSWLDVHGAGAQRSDPKSGDPAQFSKGFGPQGDAIHINNFVRLVRTIK
ncbi:MAG: DUF1566 domain-containing protein [Bacteroidaceae bacterium]